MKKFSMEGALYKSDKNPEEIKKDICRKKPAADPAEEKMIEINKDSELPKELEPLRDLVESIAPGESVTYPEKTWKTLAKWAVKSRNGASREVPMICTGQKCPYAKQCPLIKAGVNVEPLSECPVEKYLMEQWNSDMLSTITDKPGSKAFAPDLRTISHSTLMEILLRRTTMELASDPEIIKEVVVGVDDSGQPIKSEEINRKVTAAQNMIKTEEKLHDSLLATRKSKSQAGISPDGDSEDYLEGAADFADAKIVDEKPEEKRDKHPEKDGGSEGSSGDSKESN